MGFEAWKLSLRVWLANRLADIKYNMAELDEGGGPSMRAMLNLLLFVVFIICMSERERWLRRLCKGSQVLLYQPWFSEVHEATVERVFIGRWCQKSHVAGWDAFHRRTGRKDFNTVLNPLSSLSKFQLIIDYYFYFSDLINTAEPGAVPIMQNLPLKSR